MAKLTTSDITNITGAEETAIATLNSNFAAIEDALENTLSRDGTTPNTLEADLDMNGNDILNVGNINADSVTIDGSEITSAGFAKGDAATITVGTVTTGAAGSSVAVTNSGTTNAAVLNFTIPRGDTGASGAGTGDMLKANNLSDVTSAATAFGNIKQAATTSATGVVELATDTETQTGTDTSRTITPSNLTAKEATVANYRANTADRILTTDIVWSAMAEVTLTDAATIAWDMSTGFDFTVTLGGNRTLGAATNTKVGQRGRIRVVQDGTGSRTLTLNSVYKTAGGSGITLSTTASATDFIDYDVVSSTYIRLSLSKAWA